MTSLRIPAATADPTEHADWLEFSALLAPSGEVSAQDLITAVRRTGSSDAILDLDMLEEDRTDSDYLDAVSIDDAVEREDEELEIIADAAFEQLARREQFLDDQYPFTLGDVLTAKPGAVETAYSFLAAVTSFGWRNENAPESAASLFEYLSAAVLVCYLGGKDAVCSYDFGFPRRQSSSAFRDAVDELCTWMGEGGKCRTDQPGMQAVKDAKLDLVAWIPFGDSRTNQISFFGQCATGGDWRSKINELQPVDFCKTWLTEQPAMNPSLAFFVPRHITDDHWPAATIGDRRLVFDRLRIARLSGGIDDELARRCAAWTASTLP